MSSFATSGTLIYAMDFTYEGQVDRTYIIKLGGLLDGVQVRSRLHPFVGGPECFDILSPRKLFQGVRRF